MRSSSNVRCVYATLCNVYIAFLVDVSMGETEFVEKHTTNNNLNNAVLISKRSCIRERYYAAQNVNDCRALVDKALQGNKISSSNFKHKAIDTLSVTDYPTGCIVNFDREKIFFNKRTSTRTDCSNVKTCLCWHSEPTCALNLTYIATEINNATGNSTKQITPYDDDERCHCCSRETEEADLRCLSKAFCLSSSQWSIFATVLWIILQVFCCCFLPITLIIIYCNRRKGRRVYVNRNNGYGNNNTRNIEMQTLGYQNNSNNRANRTGNNYRVQTAQVVNISNYQNQPHVIQAVPIDTANSVQRRVYQGRPGMNNHNATIINNNSNNVLPPMQTIHYSPTSQYVMQNQQQQSAGQNVRN